ncbi:MAG: hypothetical protein IJZ46_04235 [Bacilli bacterium]|nr:hypothetical protein [Bacilli bacterium]
MKKKVLLMILTIISSLLLFTNKADAIVMWMQCADEVTDEISENEKFKYYSSFAVVNNLNNSDVRHLVYDSTGFYKSQKPTFIMYNKHNGHDAGEMCWYNKEYEDIDGPMSDCDSEEDFVDPSQLLSGYCPIQVMRVTNCWYGLCDTDGSVQGDMLVLQGIKQASHFEVLDGPTLVIYGFQKTVEGKVVDMMVESYFSDGKYGYATTWQTFEALADKLNMPYGDDDIDDLISEDGDYDEEYISWEAQTQGRRIAKFGKDYFKLLDDKRPWLVGAVDGQELKVIEEVNGNSIIYRSDDANGNFAKWVNSWYSNYKVQIEGQIEIMNKFGDDKEYSKLIKTAEEIKEAVDLGKKYTFDSSEYTANKMVEELELAYVDLEAVIGEDDLKYTTLNKNCQIDEKESNDALASLVTQFNCDVFGTSKVEYLRHGENKTLIDALIGDILVKQLDTLLGDGSETSIKNINKKANEYVKLFAVASNYIKKNVFFEDESVTNKIEDLSADYLTLVNDTLGVEIVLDCETLIGQDLIDEINKYLDIVKIAIPIILIGLGVIDFTKAIFAGDDSKMKKAQQDFIKRIAIAILIFLTPTIINLLLSLANKVWTFIAPSSCGLF